MNHVVTNTELISFCRFLCSTNGSSSSYKHAQKMWSLFSSSLCVNACEWQDAPIFPRYTRGKNKIKRHKSPRPAWPLGVTVTLCREHLSCGLRGGGGGGGRGGSVAVPNSLVTVPSCCSVPGLDNKSKLNDALMPGGVCRAPCHDIRLDFSAPALWEPWGGEVGLHGLN